jgi:hypothetical protein
LQNSLRAANSMIAKPFRIFSNQHNLLGLRRFEKKSKRQSKREFADEWSFDQVMDEFKSSFVEQWRKKVHEANRRHLSESNTIVTPTSPHAYDRAIMQTFPTTGDSENSDKMGFITYIVVPVESHPKGL